MTAKDSPRRGVVIELPAGQSSGDGKTKQEK